jgi:O-antigen ligase
LLLLRSGARGLKYGLIIAPVSIAVGFAAIYFFLPSFGEASWNRILASGEFFATDPNRILSGRLESWRSVLALIYEHPSYIVAGIGYKTLPYVELVGRPLVADNMYLSLLIETGIAGLAAFLWMNVCILIESYRASRRKDRWAALFGTWFVCFWVGELLQMFTGDLLTYWRVLPFYFWVLSCAVRHSRDADERLIH